MARAPLLAALCVQRWDLATSSQRPGGTLPTVGRPVWVAPPGIGRATYQVPTSQRGLRFPHTHNKGCHEAAAQAARGRVAALDPLPSVQDRTVRVYACVRALFTSVSQRQRHSLDKKKREKKTSTNSAHVENCVDTIISACCLFAPGGPRDRHLPRLGKGDRAPLGSVYVCVSATRSGGGIAPSYVLGRA